MRTALKERQKTRDVAAYRHPRILRSLYCPAFDRFFRSFRATCFFTANTQGSAKPPPWAAKFLYAFGVLDILVFLLLPTSVRYLTHFLTITLVAASPRCDLLFKICLRALVKAAILAWANLFRPGTLSFEP